MKNKKTIILLLLIAIVGVVGLTLAYFANTASVENEFNTKQYGTTVEEVFESPSDWTPGTTTPKTLTVTNSGQVDEAVRVSYTEVWTSKNSNVEGDLELSQGNNRAAIINWSNISDWTTVTENNKEYRYYNYRLAPGETTSTLLDSVTFNSAITNDSNCTTSSTATGKQVVCSSTGAGYDGATYKLVFTVETVQYDKYGEAWGTSAVIANTSKPAPVVAQTGAQKLLSTAVNDSSITSYNDASADKGKMFVFNHEATEQTDALTDYRYIGDVPNNYVKFNCDNDGTNCEIWRIIGVFSVERTDPNDSSKTITEQRIKLVRGIDFSTTMKWDTRANEELDNNNWGINEWEGSDICNFLNNNYLNRTGSAETYGLKELALSQITDAKYYLGGIVNYFNNHQYSTEKIYSFERGKTVYLGHSTEWEGKIALLYPSDEYMVYAYGVDNICYNNPSACKENDLTYSGYPSKGWIYNSNILQLSGYNNDISLLTPSSHDSSYVFFVSENGSLVMQGGGGGIMPAKIRPVVYLKSSIQIVSGEGTEQNPYVLQ